MLRKAEHFHQMRQKACRSCLKITQLNLKNLAFNKNMFYFFNMLDAIKENL